MDVRSTFQLRPTNFNASRASGSQSWPEAGSTTNHSFITRPGAGSKRLPAPDATSASTRSFGSFTTNPPLDEIIAKILSPTQRAEEPKPFLEAPTDTFRL